MSNIYDKCKKIRLYSPYRHGCSDCAINLNDHDDMTNIDLTSILTIMFMVSTNSNVSSCEIKLHNNEVMCDGDMELEKVEGSMHPELSNIKYCISMLEKWIDFNEKKNPDKPEIIAKTYLFTLSKVCDIEGLRKVLLYAFR